MHYCGLLTLVWVILLGSFGCSSSSAPTLPESTENTIKIKPSPAVLVEADDRVVDVSRLKIGSTSALTRAQFVDRDNGWVGTNSAIYRTSDGGMNWKRLDLNIPEDSYISSFFFVDPNHGWLTVIHHKNASANGDGGSSAIIGTNDGGQTWREQFSSSNNVGLRDISFVNASKGMAIGARISGGDKQRAAMILALGTNDGGMTWRDISGPMVRAIKTPYLLGNDEGNAIQWLSSSQIVVLTTRQRVVTTDDSGETWKTLVHLEEDRQSITKSGFYKPLFDSKGRSSILGGSSGDEGYWTTLITSDGRNSWQSHELLRVPLQDAIYLSGGEILACGEEHKPYDEQRKTAQMPEGIIVQSKDNGKSWLPIYRTGSDEVLIYLTQINETDFYVVSDAGSFIKFRLK